jgi:diketogulonate reductase-like aldo/keto reductase
MNIETTGSFAGGARMPLIGLGTWKLTRETADIVLEALEIGYRMIDTAVDYGTQLAIGDAMHRTGLDRDEIFLVTKVEENEDAYDGAARNLRELRLDASDLVLLHRPPDDSAGQALWEGLLRARDDGLTRHAGVSNYSEDQIETLIDATGEVPAVNQIEWSPFGWSKEMLRYCRDRGIVIQAYSPLTRGERLADPALTRLAGRYGTTTAQLVLRWDLQMGVVPLPKANDRDHLRENAAVFDFEISDADMEELGQLNEQYSSLGSLPYV